MADKKSGEIKVDKWDGNALKHAIDDAVRKVFIDDLKYSERNKYVDIRLALSGLGVGVAGYALLYDWLHPFPLSRNILIVCVLSYFVLMSILTFFMTFIEKNIILVATQKEAAGLDPDSEWKVQTTLARFDHMYQVEVSKVDGSTKKASHGSFTKCVSTWVNENGVISVDRLQTDIMAVHKSVNNAKKD